ncbi:MAG: hypothetical protein OES79_07445, partial [Planctomycetota bacterium]|nr:hypothetical protein [Planctomycetota bacterium]
MAFSNDPASIPLAIVGMGCRLPEAENLDAFWNLLIEGRSAVREMPPDRMDQELYYDPEVGKRNKSYSKLAAVLTDRTFNHEACPISDELVSSVDNTHLLMCETAAAALKNAAMDAFNLPLRNTGVYIGHVHGSTLGSDYTFTTCMEEAAHFLNNVEGFQQLPPAEQRALREGLVNEIRATRPRPNADSPDVSSCMVAGTVAQAFGLTGPFMALDSACASSLQAMLLGARALQLGQIDMAIVGGASDTKATTMVLFSTARSMSATGSRPFDEDADGLICGEGYVALVMKTLERALADGDPIQAVVRGLGVSSDGKGKSLWAPRKEGQIEAMRRAYRGDLDMSNLQYIEAHATATQVGDATELQTLSDILKPVLPEGHKIPIGAVKGNIGHTLESAGLSSVIKTVLAMQHKMVPPAINIRRLNPKIDWDSVPVFVPRSPVAWPETSASRPRCAGVNAFGIGGLNMHVSLEEYHEATHRQLVASAPSSPTHATAAAIDDDRDAIAVVGMGCLFAGAADVDQYWDLIKSGRDPKQKVPADRWRIPVVNSSTQAEPHYRDKTVGGFITDFEYDWRAHKVPPKQVANADPLQFMLLDVTDQAMRDAGYHEKPFDRTRTGVMVGSEFGGDFAFQLQMGLRLPEIEKTLRQLLAMHGITGDQATAIVEGYSTALLKDWTALIDETGSFTASTLASRLTKSWNL